MIHFKTVRQGERVAVWNMTGEVRYVDGPQRLCLFRQKVEPLPHFSAAADEYLAIEYLDGRRKNLRGPASVWFDSVRHKQIVVERALPINAHELVVVYRREGENVSRRIVRGPAMYVPTEDEWLHKFSWHGAAPKGNHCKLPNMLKFTKLRVIPDQLYFDVEGVRTGDDALLVIKLMVFFELNDVELMLDQTHDPVADFINAVSADVIDFVGSISFEEFKHRTEQLNDLETYRNLTRRAERIGYQINKVVYRGYAASDKLQAMHDDAIEARTGLKLQAETEQQAQDLADLKIQREAQRASERRELEHQQAQHEIRLKQIAHEEQLRVREAEQANEVSAKRQLNSAELDHLKATNAEKAEFLAGLKAMQVNVTRYLVAQYENPDRLIRIAGDEKPQLHLHGN